MFRREAPLLAAAFTALAVLVAAGVLTGIDQWAVDHLMPGATFHRGGAPALAEGLVPLLHAHWDNPLAIASDLVTLPASFLLALAIVVWRSRVLAAALLAAVAVEVLCKEVLVRPALHQDGLHIAAFDSSYPSGHALRSVLVAAALWPMLRGWTVAWAGASLVLLEVAGWHTPSDVAGGALLGGLALLCARAAGALRARRLAGTP